MSKMACNLRKNILTPSAIVSAEIFFRRPEYARNSSVARVIRPHPLPIL
jgi:hypothetical protein